MQLVNPRSQTLQKISSKTWKTVEYIMCKCGTKKLRGNKFNPIFWVMIHMQEHFRLVISEQEIWGE